MSGIITQSDTGVLCAYFDKCLISDMAHNRIICVNSDIACSLVAHASGERKRKNALIKSGSLQRRVNSAKADKPGLRRYDGRGDALGGGS
jgi:hypothetical protein